MISSENLSFLLGVDVFCGETIIPKGTRGSQLSFKFTIRSLVKGGAVMTIAEALSARLTELMEEKHLTAYRLSMLTGVNQTTIGDIKHKRNVAVNVRVLFELCQGLGIEIVEFFNSPLFATENIID